MSDKIVMPDGQRQALLSQMALTIRQCLVEHTYDAEAQERRLRALVSFKEAFIRVRIEDTPTGIRFIAGHMDPGEVMIVTPSTVKIVGA